VEEAEVESLFTINSIGIYLSKTGAFGGWSGAVWPNGALERFIYKDRGENPAIDRDQ